jgi:hypothetical protein
MPEATDLLQQLGSVTDVELSAREAIFSLLEEFGGYKEWAREVMLDLEAADKGSANRIGLHKMFLTALLRYSDDLDTDDDESSQEQIEAIVASKLQAVLNAQNETGLQRTREGNSS